MPWIQFCDKKNVTFIDCCNTIFLNLSKGSLNNIFQDLLNKIRSQQISQDRSYIYYITKSWTGLNPKHLLAFKSLWALKSLPNNKILDSTNLKAFAVDKLDVVKLTISVYDMVENIVGKGENAGYLHFRIFLLCFQKVSISGSLKVGIGW